IVLLERGFDTLLFIVLGAWAVVVLLPMLGGSAALAVIAPLGILFLVLLIVVPLLILFKPRMVHPVMELAKRFVPRERLDHAKQWLVLEAARLRRALATVVSKTPSRVPLAIGATFLSWSLEFGVLAYLLRAFGHDVPFVLVALGSVLVVLLTTLPLLPGGTGIAEVGAMGVFTPMAPGLTPIFILVWRVTTYYVDCTLGGLFAVKFAGAETLQVLERGKGE
ncbi:MAG: flippase-like domain-containing protein, partial [Candidatus Thermoplasmatota archaeon]|nr:flippase-like domain-containing protein [Candidatus Thermoplasmatota archaeon]